MRAITVCSIRGGVGKTTVAVALARRLAQLGERCVLIDLDPTASASTRLEGDGWGEGPTLGEAVTRRWPSRWVDLIRPGPDGLGVVPSLGLEQIGPALDGDGTAYGELSLMLQHFEKDAGVETVVIDAPPGRRGPDGALTTLAIFPALRQRGSGTLVVMLPDAGELHLAEMMVGDVGRRAVLGVVVNRVRDSVIEASRHDVGRYLEVPVLARVPFDPGESAGAVGFTALDAVVELAELLHRPGAVAEARKAMYIAKGDDAQREAELDRILEAHAHHLEQDPTAQLDPEAELAWWCIEDPDIYNHVEDLLGDTFMRQPTLPPEWPGRSWHRPLR